MKRRTRSARDPPRTGARRWRGVALKPCDAPRCFETMLDPVCGNDVDPARAPVRETFEGHVVVFCSRACREMFDAEPEAYPIAS